VAPALEDAGRAFDAVGPGIEDMVRGFPAARAEIEDRGRVLAGADRASAGAAMELAEIAMFYGKTQGTCVFLRE
jgi:hypothetical protein